MLPAKTITALIVDDEQDACRNLQAILANYVKIPVHIAGVAYNTTEAEVMIQKYNPDVIFLDIEMPYEDAFGFLERVKPCNFEIIFVTAYDAYAVKAFKLNAVDYILKPISIAELTEAVQRLEQRLAYRLQNTATHYTQVLKQLDGRTKPNKIMFRDGSDIQPVSFSDIYYVEAQGSYSRIFYTKRGEPHSVVMSYSIAEYEQMLPEEYFFRIHKSYLINCLHLKKVVSEDTNSVLLDKAYSLPVSRRRYPELLAFIKKADFI